MADKIEIVVEGKDQASGPLGAIKNALGGVLTTAAGFALHDVVAGGINALTGGLEDCIKSAISAEDVNTQLESALKSTGGAAGMTDDSLKALASSLSSITPIGGGAIKTAEAMLLTFTGIGKETFPGATKAILDMATAMNSGATPSAEQLKNTAIQVGKALNDPEKGLTALARVGVSFTEDQKKLIESLEKGGDAAGAQAVILKELQKEFGGSAEAAGKTFAGQMEIMENKVSAAKVEIGNALLPILLKLSDTVLPFVTSGVKVLADFLSTNLSPAVTKITAVFDDLVNIGKSLVTAYQAGGVMGVVNALEADIISALPTIKAKLNEWANAFVAWITPMIPPFLAKLVELENQLWAWIKQQAPIWLAQLQVWGQQLIAWIAPMIPPFLAQMGVLAGQLWAWIKQQAPVLLAQFTAWANSIIAWIVPATQDFLAHWPAMLNQFLDWIGTNAGPLLLKLGEWEVQFVKWIAPAIPKILEALASIVAAILIFVAETAATLLLKLAQWGLSFIKWIAANVLPKLPGELAKIVSLIGDWIGTTATWAENALADVGKNLIAGMWDGIKNRWATMIKDLGDLVNGLSPAIKNLLGIHSPSTVFAEIGMSMAQGLFVGWQAGMASGLTAPHMAAGAMSMASSGASGLSGGRATGAINVYVTLPAGTSQATQAAAQSGAQTGVLAAFRQAGLA